MKQLALMVKEEVNQNRANFDLEKLLPETNFHDFENNPEAAILLYHLNSGHEKFREIDTLLSLSDKDMENLQSHPAFLDLQKEIKDEILTTEENDDLLKQYLKNHGQYCAWNTDKLPSGLMEFNTVMLVPYCHVECVEKNRLVAVTTNTTKLFA